MPKNKLFCYNTYVESLLGFSRRVKEIRDLGVNLIRDVDEKALQISYLNGDNEVFINKNLINVVRDQGLEKQFDEVWYDQEVPEEARKIIETKMMR